MSTATIADNLRAVHERMAAAARRAGRDPAGVRLVAVTKLKPASAVREAHEAGQKLFGENYVQEALDKMAAVGPGPEWHLIGHLQRNKARFIPGHFRAVETLDSERLARALERQCAAAGERVEVYLQLNWTDEPTKAGIRDEDTLRRVVEAVQDCPSLVLRGLMTIPDPDLDEAGTRRVYARIRDLHRGLKAEFALGAAFTELSFGMSHDFEWAIEEGATLVRVGSAIFGSRE